MGQVNQCCNSRPGEGRSDFWSWIRQGKEKTPEPLKAPEGGFTVASWNIAAINNNPFEYWITHDDALYAQLMSGVEEFIENPGDRDIPIGHLFSEQKLNELWACMRKEGWNGVDVVEKMFQDDFRHRKIVSGFLKDKDIGSKRLASMPDRLTNTINVAGGGPPVCRPTVINNYTGSLSSVSEWWPKWRDFMFNEALEVEAKGAVKSQRPCEMLGKISRSKYPAVTEEEEKVSVPLQCLCQAIFDGVLVHVMATLSPTGQWQKIKESIVDAIFSKKQSNTLRLMNGACAGIDVICLQESAASFKDLLVKSLGIKYHVIAPEDVDPKRDQNSMVLLSKMKFPPTGHRELTADALKILGSGAPVERGDLVVVAAQDAKGQDFVLASFHGDTNGLATKAVVSAVHKVVEQQAPGSRLIFGMDANTYLKAKEGIQSVDDFLAHCDSLGLRSCWHGQSMDACFTCCNARTYLQPQLNKAIKNNDKLKKGDLNPKDHILFQQASYEVVATYKDNTGERRYTEDMCFPTLRFPSDHGIVSTVLRGVSKKEDIAFVEAGEGGAAEVGAGAAAGASGAGAADEAAAASAGGPAQEGQ